ncbi:WLM-domain-containing protein [Cryphonectria parasitica EP155]|uniref:WLM-domain-containing protein n=1 Tax=Cryphonectria parasitica (strain ATCC 38755 / EP155) TaxID=660469 RepID=A0A9P4XX25_CRYP1|nr:WLM-domain-containing protein [Cryphonectria parasitica EP155]KAF3762446.1 WLM-domain-containing protein [Cryphonectria parasitica EP155]
MPLGIQRLNAKKTHPNDRIIFIKPLKGKNEARAQEFLERIAAQCLPIMREHHLSITTLEEYEPNREFVGRNFNAGEIIQLVLRAPGRRGGGSSSTRWLPFAYVQMVMMHELAHCAQMNHSRAFWAVRNLYADQMRGLWGRGYTGEGMWGPGALLGTGAWEAGGGALVAGDEELPESLCGGTFRSRRRRKRGRKGGAGGGEELSYQERKQRRIEKKFGKNGVALGADDGVKARLEKGKRTRAAPRVAGSNRGRELRAAAALARFEHQKEEPQDEGPKVKKEEGNSGDSDEESDYEDGADIDPTADDAVDLDGKKLVDDKGNHMVKVCEDEDPDDEEAANEMKELQSSITAYFAPSRSKPAEDREQEEAPANPAAPQSSREIFAGEDSIGPPRRSPRRDNRPRTARRTCGSCSFANEAYTVTCSMCSNVLVPESVPGTWSCQSASCRGGNYLNAGDCGTCGVCGQRKDAAAAAAAC